MKTVRYIGVLDDEIIAVRGMIFQLEKLLPQAEVKGFTLFREFELWCENNAPELVFLDMEMPHAMGLEVAKRIQPDVGNIVFVTAHSHYSLEAFETAVDYILKPITPKRLQQALTKVESLVPVKVQQEQKIKLLLKGTFRELTEIDIAFLRGQRNYTEVVLTNGEHHLMARTLKSFTDVLSDGFVRIHKSIVVQRALIASIQPGNPAHVLLTDGTQLDAAKARLKALGNDV